VSVHVARKLYEAAVEVWPTFVSNWDSCSEGVRLNWLRFATVLVEEGLIRNEERNEFE
jgi:hypothetical protein